MNPAIAPVANKLLADHTIDLPPPWDDCELLFPVRRA